MKDVVAEVREGRERFHPMSRGEKAVWAATYASCLSSGHGAHSAARTAAARVRDLRGEVVCDPDLLPEEVHMVREVVNLEAALGPEYRDRLRRVAGAVDRDVLEVDDQLASCLMWLDHNRYAMAAAALRLESGQREDGLNDQEVRERIVALGELRDRLSAEVVRLLGLDPGGREKNKG